MVRVHPVSPYLRASGSGAHTVAATRLETFTLSFMALAIRHKQRPWYGAWTRIQALDRSRYMLPIAGWPMRAIQGPVLPGEVG
jgi:hypothetical protein